jgi:hypothetical protein
MNDFSFNQSDFSVGQIDAVLSGRVDNAFLASALKTLRNVYVSQFGTLKRRPGTVNRLYLTRGARIESFATSEELLILVLDNGSLDMVEGDVVISSIEGCPWFASSLEEMSILPITDRVFFSHKSWAPRVLLRDSKGDWVLREWEYDTILDDDSVFVSAMPFSRFGFSNITLQVIPDGGDGQQKVEIGESFTIRASEPIFGFELNGLLLRIEGRHVRVVNAYSGVEARAVALQTLVNFGSTLDWDEQAFSDFRGWPSKLTLHQGRLVIGGSASVPNGLWFSRVGELLNFNTGTGLDDDAIAVRLAGAKASIINNLFSSEDLHVFMNDSEWVVQGSPVTPRSLSASVQTSIGSHSSADCRPINIDGKTLFVSSNGVDIHEFYYEGERSGYQQKKINAFSATRRGSINSVSYDQKENLLLVTDKSKTIQIASFSMQNGNFAWSEYEFNTEIEYCINHGDGLLLLAKWYGEKVLIEFESRVYADHCVERLVSSSGEIDLSEFDSVKQNMIVYNELGEYTISEFEHDDDLIEFLGEKVMLGLPFCHQIVPYAPSFNTTNVSGLNVNYRPISVRFLLHNTQEMRVSVDKDGEDWQTVELAVGENICEILCIGWRKTHSSNFWSVKQCSPRYFELSAVFVKGKVNN